MANAERENRNVMGRGRFLGFLGGAGFAAVSGIPVIAHLEKLLGSEGQIDEKLKAELEASGLVGFAHNGANQKEFFDEFLKNKVANIEIDTQYKGGRLYVAHHTRELNSLPWIQPEEVDLEVILANVTVNNINPHFDLKESVNNPNGIKLFREFLEDEKKIPAQLNVTLSSQEWQVLETLLESQRPHLTLFTVSDRHQIPQLEQLALKLGPRGNIGVSFEKSVVNENVINRFNSLGLKVVVWTVNDAEDALTLARMGVWGITSDETNLLKALNPK